MTQKEFNRKFTKTGFLKFLANMTPEEIAQCNINDSNCFFRLYAIKLFPNYKVCVFWCRVLIYPKDNSKPMIDMNYPQWAANYLAYLRKLIDPSSQEFTKMARKASVEFLND